MLNYAAQFLGVPYVCSGSSAEAALTAPASPPYVFKNTVGSIPRVAQAGMMPPPVFPADLLPGDLVFFSGSLSSISHVGIYVGGNQFIHAPSTGDVVKILVADQRLCDPLSGRRPRNF